MIIGKFLQDTTGRLRQAGIDSARLDCLLLLEDILGRDRAFLLAHPEIILTDQQIIILNKKIVQRMQHMPLAYIRGQASFYGRQFTVNPAVLVPRPESEAMIDLLREFVSTVPETTRSLRIADIGTGSGCLGITAALELPGSQIDLYDIDRHALDVAAINAEHFGLQHIGMHQEDLLGVTFDRKRYDVILANLPYVPDDYPINQAAQHEPRIALFAGSDGLDLYRRLWSHLAIAPHRPPAQVLTEALLPQHAALAAIARQAGYRLVRTQGFVQHFSSS